MQKIERSGAGNAIFNIEDILLCYAKYYGIMSVRGNKPCARGCPIKAGRGGMPAALRGAEMPARLNISWNRAENAFLTTAPVGAAGGERI